MKFAYYFSIFCLAYVCLGDSTPECIDKITFTGRLSQWNDQKVDYSLLSGNNYENLTTHLTQNAKMAMEFISDCAPEFVRDVSVDEVNQETDMATITVSLLPPAIHKSTERPATYWMHKGFKRFDKYASNVKFTSKNGEEINVDTLYGNNMHKIGLIVHGYVDLKQGALPADYSVSCDNETLRLEIEKAMQFMIRRVDGYRGLGKAVASCNSCSGTKMKCTLDYRYGIVDATYVANLQTALRGWTEVEQGNYYFDNEVTILQETTSAAPKTIKIRGNVAQWNGEELIVENVDRTELQASLLNNVRSALYFVTPKAAEIINSLTVESCDAKTATATIELNAVEDVDETVNDLMNAMKKFSKLASNFEFKAGEVNVTKVYHGIQLQGPIKFKQGGEPQEDIRIHAATVTAGMEKALEFFIRRRDGYRNYGYLGFKCDAVSATDVACKVSWVTPEDNNYRKVYEKLKAWDTSNEPAYFLREVKVAS